MNLNDTVKIISQTPKNEEILFIWKPHISLFRIKFLIYLPCIIIIFLAFLAIFCLLIMAFFNVVIFPVYRDSFSMSEITLLFIFFITFANITYKKNLKTYENENFIITNKNIYFYETHFSIIKPSINKKFQIPLNEISYVNGNYVTKSTHKRFSFRALLENFFPTKYISFNYEGQGRLQTYILTFDKNANYEGIFNFFAKRYHILPYDLILNSNESTQILWNEISPSKNYIQEEGIRNILLWILALVISWFLSFPLCLLVIVFWITRFITLIEIIEKKQYIATYKTIYFNHGVDKIQYYQIKNFEIKKATLLNYIFNVRTLIIDYEDDNMRKQEILKNIPNWKELVLILDEYKNNQNPTINKEI